MGINKTNSKIIEEYFAAH